MRTYPMAREDLVWFAMARAEINHGGPLLQTVGHVQRYLLQDRAAPTVRKALHTLAALGIVERKGNVSNNHQWMLTRQGRLKYGLPNEHGSGVGRPVG